MESLHVVGGRDLLKEREEGLDGSLIVDQVDICVFLDLVGVCKSACAVAVGLKNCLFDQLAFVTLDILELVVDESLLEDFEKSYLHFIHVKSLIVAHITFPVLILKVIVLTDLKIKH